MLKKRVAAVVLVRHGIIVQSIGFRCYLPVGRPPIAVEFLTSWGADEIILLDITATPEERPIAEQAIASAAARCRVPLTVGGGLRTVDDVRTAVHSGADKVAINTAAFASPELITKASRVFGRRCIIVSIDARRTVSGGYEVCLIPGASRPVATRSISPSNASISAPGKS